jgi:hypothetical protein
MYSSNLNILEVIHNTCRGFKELRIFSIPPTISILQTKLQPALGVQEPRDPKVKESKSQESKSLDLISLVFLSYSCLSYSCSWLIAY